MVRPLARTTTARSFANAVTGQGYNATVSSARMVLSGTATGMFRPLGPGRPVISGTQRQYLSTHNRVLPGAAARPLVPIPILPRAAPAAGRGTWQLVPPGNLPLPQGLPLHRPGSAVPMTRLVNPRIKLGLRSAQAIRRRTNLLDIAGKLKSLSVTAAAAGKGVGKASDSPASKRAFLVPVRVGAAPRATPASAVKAAMRSVAAAAAAGGVGYLHASANKRVPLRNPQRLSCGAAGEQTGGTLLSGTRSLRTPMRNASAAPAAHASISAAGAPRRKARFSSGAAGGTASGDAETGSIRSQGQHDGHWQSSAACGTATKKRKREVPDDENAASRKAVVLREGNRNRTSGQRTSSGSEWSARNWSSERASGSENWGQHAWSSGDRRSNNRISDRESGWHHDRCGDNSDRRTGRNATSEAAASSAWREHRGDSDWRRWADRRSSGGGDGQTSDSGWRESSSADNGRAAGRAGSQGASVHRDSDMRDIRKRSSCREESGGRVSGLRSSWSEGRGGYSGSRSSGGGRREERDYHYDSRPSKKARKG